MLAAAAKVFDMLRNRLAKLSSVVGLITIGCGPTTPANQLGSTPPPRTPSDRRIIGTNNLESAYALKGTRAYEFTRSIARLENTLDGYGYCSAVRVGERFFMTNQHCLRRCDQMRFRLGYESEQTLSQQAIYRCRKVIASSEPLDYALVLVDIESEPGLISYPSAQLASGMPHTNLPTVLASMPLADESAGYRRYKAIDRSPDCRLGVNEVFTSSSGRKSLMHYCDTNAGSSGAALFDAARGVAVALHWGGYEGSYNMAIPMSLIVADLKLQVGPSMFSF